jgi:DNA-binding CsgD family transcriptional regulator
MSQQEKRISDSNFSRWVEGSVPPDDDFEVARLSAARARAVEEAGAGIARQLNGPMTALLLYMGEVVENALQQTEHVCAMIKQMADSHEAPLVPPAHKTGLEARSAQGKDGSRAPGVMSSSGSSQKPLTRREREVLNLISEGHSNKQGALRMRISPRTFESHRAEAMRKLGARNTAELVRSALLHSGGA